MEKRELVAVDRRVLSPWVTLVERTVGDGERRAVYHSLDQRDYVSIMALTKCREIVLVRQYRPALDRMTLELPGGLLDEAEMPSECALRELHEETGFRPSTPLIDLGELAPDSGRLENRLHAYFVAEVESDVGWVPERGVVRSLVPIAELASLVRDGSFDHALHVAILALVMLRGLVPELGSWRG